MSRSHKNFEEYSDEVAESIRLLSSALEIIENYDSVSEALTHQKKLNADQVEKIKHYPNLLMKDKKSLEAELAKLIEKASTLSEEQFNEMQKYREHEITAVEKAVDELIGPIQKIFDMVRPTLEAAINSETRSLEQQGAMRLARELSMRIDEILSYPTLLDKVNALEDFKEMVHTHYLYNYSNWRMQPASTDNMTIEMTKVIALLRKSISDKQLQDVKNMLEKLGYKNTKPAR